jgi:hypothetical protein
VLTNTASVASDGTVDPDAANNASSPVATTVEAPPPAPTPSPTPTPTPPASGLPDTSAGSGSRPDQLVPTVPFFLALVAALALWVYAARWSRPRDELAAIATLGQVMLHERVPEIARTYGRRTCQLPAVPDGLVDTTLGEPSPTPQRRHVGSIVGSIVGGTGRHRGHACAPKALGALPTRVIPTACRRGRDPQPARATI